MVMSRIESSSLDEYPLLATLSPARRRSLLDTARLRRFKRGEVLFHKDDPGDSLFLIQSGEVKLVLPGLDGKEKLLRVLTAGDVLGEMAIIDGAPRSATAVAVKATTTLSLRRDVFIEALTAEPGAALRLCAILAEKLRLTTEALEDATFLDVPGRLAKVLLDLASRNGVKQPDGTVRVELTLTQQELADMIGGTRARVNEHLQSFARLGWLQLDRNAVTLVKPAMLRRRCE